MKKLFAWKTRGHGSVVLNWHGKSVEEFPFFAEAFHDVAKQAAMAQRRKKNFGEIPHEDYKAYPVVFLYRHALELAMKAIILAGAPILELKGDTPVNLEKLLGEHGLEALRQDVERVFKACGWSRGVGVSHFKTSQDFRQVIQEFGAIDPHPAVAFRYPVSKQRKPLLAPSLSFDLLGFCEVLDLLLPVLLAAASAARDIVEAESEWRAEASQAERENGDCEPE